MNAYLGRYTSALPLAVFRIVLGLMMFVSILRFYANGWIEELYIKPKYFFHYHSFEFIKPLGNYTYLLFAVCALSALLVALGLYYRISILTFFLTFTYIELIDKTTYLNHYYFISMISLLMVFLPAHCYYSMDAYKNPRLRADLIPSWTVDSIKLFVTFLYVFAGISKINSDWLLHALPLKIWLPAHNDIPVIGFLFNYPVVHYLFSWFGCIYDLVIPFLLWNGKRRPFAYVAVVVFHLLTSFLFQIGMFPYVMIVTALIFFPHNFHMVIIQKINLIFKAPVEFLQQHCALIYSKVTSRLIQGILICFFLFQMVMPFRYLLYPGELFWTEQGYRFSWRVMLMEKAGHTQFRVKDLTGKQFQVNNNEFLTPLQEKAMSTQPDMILQYAHILRDYYVEKSFTNPEVYVDSYVAINGKFGRTFIDPTVNLALENESFQHKSWILLHED